MIVSRAVYESVCRERDEAVKRAERAEKRADWYARKIVRAAQRRLRQQKGPDLVRDASESMPRDVRHAIEQVAGQDPPLKALLTRYAQENREAWSDDGRRALLVKAITYGKGKGAA